MSDNSKVAVQERAVRELIRDILAGERKSLPEARGRGRKGTSLRSTYDDKGMHLTDYSEIMKAINKTAGMKSIASPSSVRLIDMKTLDKVRFMLKELRPEEREELVKKAVDLFKKQKKMTATFDSLGPSDKASVERAALKAYKHKLVTSGKLDWTDKEYILKHPDADAAIRSGTNFKEYLPKFWEEVKTSPTGPLALDSFRDFLDKIIKKEMKSRGHKPDYLGAGDYEAPDDDDDV